MIYLSKKRRHQVNIILVACLVIVDLTDLLGSWLFAFDLNSSTRLAVSFSCLLALCIVNLLYYWRGEGATERGRYESLRMLIATTVILVLAFGLYLWFGG